MDNITNMSDLNEWNDITRGLYRFVLSAGACYEIHVLYYSHDTDILTAKASLYIVGDWQNKDSNFFERECLLSEQPVFECINKALEYYKENMWESEE